MAKRLILMTRFSRLARIARLTSKILITGILGLALVVGMAYLLFPKEVLSQLVLLDECTRYPHHCIKLLGGSLQRGNTVVNKRIHGTNYTITNTRVVPAISFLIGPKQNAIGLLVLPEMERLCLGLIVKRATVFVRQVVVGTP